MPEKKGGADRALQRGLVGGGSGQPALRVGAGSRTAAASAAAAFLAAAAFFLAAADFLAAPRLAAGLFLAAALPAASNVSMLAERLGSQAGAVARLIWWSTLFALLSLSGWAHSLGVVVKLP